MQTADNLERVAREFAEDLIADGVVYAEIRWAPELHLEQGLDMRGAIDAVQRGIESAVEGGRASGRPTQAFQLLCAMRQNDRADAVADLAIEYRGRGVVGFDIAGPEAGFPVSRLASAFAKLDAAWVPRTVHAGEADGLASIEGALLDERAEDLEVIGAEMADAFRGGDSEHTELFRARVQWTDHDRRVGMDAAAMTADAWLLSEIFNDLDFLTLKNASYQTFTGTDGVQAQETQQGRAI
jgi:hypothetical protein